MTSIIRERMEKLKEMDAWLRHNIQDEELFISWLYEVPDQATEDDYENIARDDEAYNSCHRTFVWLVLEDGVVDAIAAQW